MRIALLVAVAAGVAALVVGVITDHGSTFVLGVFLIAVAAAGMIVQYLFTSQRRAAEWGRANSGAFGALAELPVGAALTVGVLHARRRGLARTLSMIFGGRLLGRITISADEITFEVPQEGRRIGLDPKVTISWHDVSAADLKPEASQRDAGVLHLVLRPNIDLSILVYGHRDLIAAVSDLSLPISH